MKPWMNLFESQCLRILKRLKIGHIETDEIPALLEILQDIANNAIFHITAERFKVQMVLLKKHGDKVSFVSLDVVSGNKTTTKLKTIHKLIKKEGDQMIAELSRHQGQMNSVQDMAIALDFLREVLEVSLKLTSSNKMTVEMVMLADAKAETSADDKGLVSLDVLLRDTLQFKPKAHIVFKESSTVNKKPKGMPSSSAVQNKSAEGEHRSKVAQQAPSSQCKAPSSRNNSAAGGLQSVGSSKRKACDEDIPSGSEAVLASSKKNIRSSNRMAILGKTGTETRSGRADIDKDGTVKKTSAVRDSSKHVSADNDSDKNPANIAPVINTQKKVTEVPSTACDTADLRETLLDPPKIIVIEPDNVNDDITMIHSSGSEPVKLSEQVSVSRSTVYTGKHPTPVQFFTSQSLPLMIDPTGDAPSMIQPASVTSMLSLQGPGLQGMRIDTSVTAHAPHPVGKEVWSNTGAKRVTIPLVSEVSPPAPCSVVASPPQHPPLPLIQPVSITSMVSVDEADPLGMGISAPGIPATSVAASSAHQQEEEARVNTSIQMGSIPLVYKGSPPSSVSLVTSHPPPPPPLLRCPLKRTLDTSSHDSLTEEATNIGSDKRAPTKENDDPKIASTKVKLRVGKNYETHFWSDSSSNSSDMDVNLYLQSDEDCESSPVSATSTKSTTRKVKTKTKIIKRRQPSENLPLNCGGKRKLKVSTENECEEVKTIGMTLKNRRHIQFITHSCYICRLSHGVAMPFDTQELFVDHLRKEHFTIADNGNAVISCHICQHGYNLTAGRIKGNSKVMDILTQHFNHMLNAHHIEVPAYMLQYTCRQENCNFITPIPEFMQKHAEGKTHSHNDH